MINAEDTLVEPSGTTADGIQIFERSKQSYGYGFALVIEARPGGTRAKVGKNAFNYNPSDPTVLPNLRVEVSRNLGDGSTAVCDNSPGDFGGVPAVDPPDFSPTAFVAAAINDFACRFEDEFGAPGGRTDNSCVAFPDGRFYFVAKGTTVQFCGSIEKPFAFPTGDTVVTGRVSDVAGNVSQPAQIVVRISP